MPRKRLTVELPVCPVATCRHIGKMPLGVSSVKNYCRGPNSAPHARAKMEPQTFVGPFVESKA